MGLFEYTGQLESGAAFEGTLEAPSVADAQQQLADMRVRVLALRPAKRLLLALEYFMLQAPDVAIAEAAIGAGLSTAIYIIALRACKALKSPRGGEGR